jgi:monoamine oxidase
MARTPLFALVERALREAQSANRIGIPSLELVERVRDRRINRRDFLAASGAALATTALTRCKSVVASPRTEDPVLIVGAGIAGLSAAYRLTRAGVPVRIIDAQNRVGGRMFSIRDFFADGQVAELGGELIDTGHQSIRSLASELGIELDDLSQEDPSLSTDLFFFDGARRREAEIVDAFRPIARAIEADLATLTGEGEVTYSEQASGGPLDRISIAQWLDRHGVSGWIRKLLEVGYTTEFGLEIDEQSALNLLTMIDPNPDPFRIFGESDERFHVRGGNDLIVSALASRLGTDVETNTRLEAVARSADGNYVCSVRRDGTSVPIRAPRVVLALPFTLLRQVRIDFELPPAKRKAIDELGYGTNTKLMTGFNDRIWRKEGMSNGSVLTDLPFQLCWETSRHQPGNAGIITNFSGGRHGVELGGGSDAEQSRAFVEHLERIFPGVSATREGMKQVRFHWPSFRYTLGSYASYKVGQWTTIRGAEGERAGNLHFAGEHCSLDFQGFMEGGCETGEAVARVILEELGLEAERAA